MRYFSQCTRTIWQSDGGPEEVLVIYNSKRLIDGIAAKSVTLRTEAKINNRGDAGRGIDSWLRKSIKGLWTRKLDEVLATCTEDQMGNGRNGEWCGLAVGVLHLHWGFVALAAASKVQSIKWTKLDNFPQKKVTFPFGITSPKAASQGLSLSLYLYMSIHLFRGRSILGNPCQMIAHQGLLRTASLIKSTKMLQC